LSVMLPQNSSQGLHFSAHGLEQLLDDVPQLRKACSAQI
jgi:hypothetical protein